MSAQDRVVTTVRPEPGRWLSSPLTQEQEIRARALRLAANVYPTGRLCFDDLGKIQDVADVFAAYITSGSKPGEKVAR